MTIPEPEDEDKNIQYPNIPVDLPPVLPESEKDENLPPMLPETEKDENIEDPTIPISPVVPGFVAVEGTNTTADGYSNLNGENTAADTNGDLPGSGNGNGYQNIEVASDEEEIVVVPEVEPVVETSPLRPITKQWRFWTLVMLLICAIVLISVLSTIEFDRNRTDDPDTATVSAPSMIAPSFKPTITSEPSSIEPTTERYALEKIYEASNPNDDCWTKTDNWNNNDTHYCDWYGIYCSDDMHVISLSFSENGLCGTLASEIGLLDRLQWVDLAFNSMHGAIPEELFSLREIKTIWLVDNGFNGTISQSIGQLRNLEQYDIQGTQMRGTIPTEIGLCTQLDNFQFSKSLLTGTLPSEVGNFDLTFFFGRYGNVGGTLPTEIGKWSKNKYFDVRSSNFGGQLPSEVGLMTNLTFLTLHDCQFDGFVPSEFGMMKKLQELWASGNKLENFFMSLEELENLSMVSLEDNLIYGSLPTAFGNATESLEELILGKNLFTGTIPSEMGTLINLDALALHANQLTGPVPTELGLLKDLKAFAIYGNPGITGAMPNEVCDLWNESLQLLFSDCHVCDLPCCTCFPE